MNAVKCRVVSGVVWTNRTWVSSNTVTNRTELPRACQMMYGPMTNLLQRCLQIKTLIFQVSIKRHYQHLFSLKNEGGRGAKRLACSPLSVANRAQSPSHSGIFGCGTRAGRCRSSAGIIGDLPFPPPLHSDVAPFSPHFTLIGSQDLVVKSRPNLFTHSTQITLSLTATLPIDLPISVPTEGIVVFVGKDALSVHRHPEAGGPLCGPEAAASDLPLFSNSFQDKLDVKHVYTEVDFAIGSEFIRHALDDSEPIADLQGNKWRVPYCQVWSNTGYSMRQQPMNKHLRLEYIKRNETKMEHRRNVRAREVGDPRENPRRLRERLQWGIEPGSLLYEASTLASTLPRPLGIQINGRGMLATLYRWPITKASCDCENRVLKSSLDIIMFSRNTPVPVRWSSAVAVEGDDWARVLQDVPNAARTND
ncbi:hypothetical protein PR048_033229 [Dryococelus australis]|uniref:Uncharacterized protein n=1 Tax=Dryococelus australis TaxID=614101 RepID=A0ABQ9G3Y1_9NEOP|nr:hypothetical protein PR048_033229 [Dryococelus australis]